MPKFQNIKVVHRYLKQGRKTNSERNARTGNKLRNLALFFRFRGVSFSKIEKTFSKSLKSLLKVLLRQLSKCFCGSNYVSVIRNPCFNDLNVETNRSAKSAENEWKSGTDQTPQEAKQATNADWRVLRQLPVTLALFGPDIVQKGGKVQGFGSSFK